MSSIPKLWSRFVGGIADFPREGIPDSYAFGRSIDVRSDPQNIGVLPRTIKESGTTITDLVKWGETISSTSTTYLYGATGNLYSRSSAAAYTFLRAINTSHGNGLVYSQEDDFLWYARDKVIGRYGPISSSIPTFSDDFFGSQGGTPANTNSLQLLSASTQYASRADTASLSITGSLAFDVQIKPTTLPAVNNQMVLLSKWDESGALRSYKFDINTVAGPFGTGSDGVLIVTTNTTEAPIDSACTGTSGSTTLSATNASFAANQIVLIHQTQGTHAGTWMRNTINAYTAGTITLTDPLNSTYTAGAQVRVLKQYTTVTVNTGITYTAKAWNGTVGGILGFICSGTFTNNGTITASGKGYRGGVSVYSATSSADANSGENNTNTGSATYLAVGNGGGGGSVTALGSSAPGGGGGNGTVGTSGNTGIGTYNVGQFGATTGSADLTTLSFGGGGGGGAAADVISRTVGDGGDGGGAIIAYSAAIVNTGSIVSTGVDGTSTTDRGGAGGGGAGGSVLLKCQTATLGSSLITAAGGAGGTGDAGVIAGSGGVGRIHLDYYTSYTGTTSPTLDVTQDGTLVANTSTQLRLLLSSTGSNSETLAQTVTIQTGVWQQVGVSWNSSTSTATFYVNAVAIGTKVGSLTAIHDNASTFQIGMYKNVSSLPTGLYNGLMDEVRLFNTTRTDAEMLYGLIQELATNTAGLQAYYQLDNGYTDSTTNANNLTATNAPTFSTDVPYASPQTPFTRNDVDQSVNTTGSTYAVPTAISETATNRLTFTPAKDPQKSIAFNVSNIGTGAWTITIHDQYNNVMATSTVANAKMNTGFYEFIFSSVWRPLTNFTNEYHAHITCASGSPTIVTTSSNDLETAYFITYFQFLVNDTAWHPMMRFLNFWIVGNERYLGKYEAPLYEPNKLVLESGERVRALAKWNEYAAIGVFRGQNIYDFDKGRIYLWDGISPTFNTSIEIEDGGINAMIGTRGKLYIWAGYKNQLYVYQGGNEAVKLKDMPNLEPDDYTEIYPQAVCVWESLLRYGVSGNSNSTTLQKGVYTYGSTNLRYPEVLTYDYPLSTSNYTGLNLNIGCTLVVNRKLLIGWQDGQGYGVDYVDMGNDPFPSAMIQFPIYDADAIWKEKEAVEIVANTTPLQSGESILISYSKEDSGIFTSNPDLVTTGDNLSRMLITDGRYNEMQVQVDITSGTTSPIVKGVTLISNLNETEGRY